MRTLLWMRDGRDTPGGHAVQWQKTAEALEELGVQVESSTESSLPLAGFDVVHGCGLLPEQVRAVRQARLPLAISTIYWSRAYRCGMTFPLGMRTLKHRLRLTAAFARETLRGHLLEKCDHYMAKWIRERALYENADILLPNSAAEGEQIVADLGVSTPMHVVPNGANGGYTPTPGAPRHGVLYVGRFEPHKNQLGFLRAVKGCGLPITLIGPPHPDHPEYYRRCQQAAAETGATILPPLPHAELGPIYAAHRVHILPSWFETTGLVSLEAALCGCNIVTTNRGYARSYFGDLAWYCDPARPGEMRRAIRAAHEAPARPALAEKILREFTWRRAGEETLRAYEKITAHAPVPVPA